VPCTDAALLFHHYGDDDLHAAGMPLGHRRRFYAPDLAPEAKWRLLAPYWPTCRSTGYMQAIRRTARLLFGERDIDADSFVRISEGMQERARPGLYRRVLATAGVESCQVNSLEATYCETAQPDLLLQDLSLVPYTVELDLGKLAAETGIAARTLDDMDAIVDWYFERYGPRAVAVKTQSAYRRRLDYAAASWEAAGPAFRRYAGGAAVSPAERKVVEDYLMRRCFRLAGERRLPVKLHCGYYAGNDRMPLGRVRKNASDLCPVLAAFPETTFVLMHIGYPYQDEYIALAKHYANVVVDLCWAWVISPLATVRFVREFLTTAPAAKLLTFGGDYANVEPIVGQASMARQGLAHALDELVAGRWLGPEEAADLVEPLMRGNARRVFNLAPAGHASRSEADTSSGFGA
jgi:uncharacterized protein